MHKSIHLSDAQATIELGRYLAANLTAGTVLLLEGDLGSGKTTLVQGIAQALGISETILSPTFTLICEYLDGYIPLYHLDLYRLNPEQVIDLNLVQLIMVLWRWQVMFLNNVLEVGLDLIIQLLQPSMVMEL